MMQLLKNRSKLEVINSFHFSGVMSPAFWKRITSSPFLKFSSKTPGSTSCIFTEGNEAENAPTKPGQTLHG